jgi:hypothetical protein
MRRGVLGTINGANRKDYKGNTTPHKRRSIYDSSHQLEDGHPASLRDLDEANKHHFIGGDLAMPHEPFGGWKRRLKRNAFAVLKVAQ